MYAKEKVLIELKDKGLNIFPYDIITSEADLLYYHIFHPNFTIRYTREIACGDLPFYIVSKNTDAYKVSHIAREAELLNCAMLCSDGIVHDKDMVCNFVFSKTTDGRFLLEWHTGNIPLRHMYKNADTAVIEGSILGSTEDFSHKGYNTRSLGYTDLQYILDFMEEINIFNKQVECTLYNKPVGIRKERIIVWGLS